MDAGRRAAWILHTRTMGLEPAPELRLRADVLDPPGILPDSCVSKPAQARTRKHHPSRKLDPAPSTLHVILLFNTVHGEYQREQIPDRV